MGTWFAQQQMHGVCSPRVVFRVKSVRGAASGGTIASLLNFDQWTGPFPTGEVAGLKLQG